MAETVIEHVRRGAIYKIRLRKIYSIKFPRRLHTIRSHYSEVQSFNSWRWRSRGDPDGTERESDQVQEPLTPPKYKVGTVLDCEEKGYYLLRPIQSLINAAIGCVISMTRWIV